MKQNFDYISQQLSVNNKEYQFVIILFAPAEDSELYSAFLNQIDLLCVDVCIENTRYASLARMATNFSRMKFNKVFFVINQKRSVFKKTFSRSKE